MIPYSTDELCRSGAPGWIVPEIELYIPDISNCAPEPDTPAPVVQAIVDQAPCTCTVKEKGEWDRKIVAGTKVQIAIIRKLDPGIGASCKLDRWIGGAGIIRGVAGAICYSCYIGRSCVTGVAAKFKMA